VLQPAGANVAITDRRPCAALAGRDRRAQRLRAAA
jgi:hypothetical protein